MKLFKKYYVKAIEILDALNELMNDIDYDLDFEQSESLEEYNATQLLYWALEDTEAVLSDNLYDSEIEDAYNSAEEHEGKEDK